MSNNLTNTRTLTSRLAIFFTGVAFVMGFASYVIFYTALHWSEDRVGERRIQIDKTTAIQRFMDGENGKITIDILTTAYNDIQLVPPQYLKHFQGRDTFVGEVGEDPDSRMLYFGYYYKAGERKPVVLVTDVDKVEFGQNETLFAGIVVVTCVAGLLLLFGGLLYRLSQHLIEPINHLTSQLTRHSGNAEHVFEIPPGGATEFQQLADQLNQYRQEIHSLLKREQAFARYASHELRTPLTIIRGANKLLDKKSSNDFQQRQINRIEEATQQMSTMVDALLGLVRYERSDDDTITRAVEQDEFQTIIEQNSAQAHDKDIDVALIFNSSPQLKASPAVLNMVVGNLIRNAIAATNEGQIALEVSSDSLSVKDNGPGLSDTPNQEGHGLGLLIVDDLCRRYQWVFSLSNQSSGGCEALIRFDR